MAETCVTHQAELNEFSFESFSFLVFLFLFPTIWNGFYFFGILEGVGLVCSCCLECFFPYLLPPFRSPFFSESSCRCLLFVYRLLF